MITHLLDIDALENNRVTVFMDMVNIRELVQQVVHSFDKQAHKKDIKLTFNALCDNCQKKMMIRLQSV
jgi:hypothetical protein